jgi:hypothetical protein
MLNNNAQFYFFRTSYHSTHALQDHSVQVHLGLNALGFYVFKISQAVCNYKICNA